MTPPSLGAGHRPRVGPGVEPLHYLAEHGPYRGALPAFYDTSAIPAAAILERHHEEIRDEVLALLHDRPDAFGVNFTPEGLNETRWQTLNLVTDRLRYHRNRALLPVTTRVVDSLPGLSFAQVGVLEPGCVLGAHHGDTNAMFRLHLGIQVPGSLPDVGIEVAGERRAWNAGEVLAFEDAHRHSVWNLTDSPRVVLVVDVLKDELLRRRRWICARAGAGIIRQSVAAKAGLSGRAPHWLATGLSRVLTVVVWIGLPAQRRLAWGSSRRSTTSRPGPAVSRPDPGPPEPTHR